MNNQARTPAPSSARTSTSVRASTPTRTPTPVRTPTAVRTRTPIRTLTPSLAGTPALVPTTTPARISRLVPTPAPAWTSTPVPTPTPARTPTPIPTLVRTLTPVRLPAPARIPAPVPAPAPVPVPVPVPAPVPAPEDREPAPSLRLVPSVSGETGPAAGPPPAHTPLATNPPGPTLDFTADSSATGLADPTIPSSVPAPILGTIPSAASLLNSTESFVSASESFALDKRVPIRYILLKKSLEQRFPDRLLFEEDRAAQATGDFEVFVDGRLVHSKKRGDGFVDEAKLQKIVSIIDEEIKKR
uniref:Selenoprotein V n=1 Tax=Cebus imitator TaxID=2715852 RepID=A0A2K5PBE0_CEBIM